MCIRDRLQIDPVDVRGLPDLEAAAATIRRSGAQAVFVPADLSLQVDPHQVVRWIRKTNLPAVYQDHVFVDAGGLMSYGHSNRETIAGMVEYADRILKGAKPGDLPVIQVRNLRLVVNKRAARELEISIPQQLLIRADEVIE